jgi:hypothetical protein
MQKAFLMQRAFNCLLLLMLILAVSPVSAQFDDEELQLVPLPTELRLSGMARVVTNIAGPGECFAPVAITRIDGEKVAVSAQSFVIEAGLHSINGKATLDISSCPITDSRLQISSAEDLEMNFELGYTYYISYYHQSANPEDWQLVVWNIETNP